MILDSIHQSRRYRGVHPGFSAAIDLLGQTPLGSLTPGRHTVDGDRLQLVVVREEGHSREGVRFESHRRYVDIQYTLSGEDLIGWKPVAQCTNDQEPFDVVKDVGYYVDRPELWIPVPTGTFVVFFPEDAHAPMGGTGLIHKIVVKVAVDWR